MRGPGYSCGGLCLANVPVFSSERQKEPEGRPSAIVRCNALLDSTGRQRWGVGTLVDRCAGIGHQLPVPNERRFREFRLFR